MWRDLLELVRAPAALSVPGDAIAGAAAADCVSGRTAGLAAASVCLYYAGMAANDWADRELDEIERPERPIPSGRITPSQALTVASGLTAAGLGIAALAGGRRALSVAVPLTAAIWAYDLKWKNTAQGPAVMAACRGLDVLLGASAGRITRALPTAAVVAAHTYVVTELSRHEVHGADSSLARKTLPATAAIAAAATSLRRPTDPRRPATTLSRPTFASRATAASKSAAGPARKSGMSGLDPVAATTLSGWYLKRFGTAQRKVLDKPNAENIRAAVGAGIMALPALQGALTARQGRPMLGALVALGAALGKRLARRAT